MFFIRAERIERRLRHSVGKPLKKSHFTTLRAKILKSNIFDLTHQNQGENLDETFLVIFKRCVRTFF